MLSNKNEQELAKLNIKVSKNGYSLNISFADLGHRIDLAQAALDAQVWKDVQRYMPERTGALISETNALNASSVGKVYLYPPSSDYGHYQYTGEVYVDRKYNKAAFYNPAYGFWSRKGVSKIPGGRPLNYSQPNAHAKWGMYAIARHKNEWLDLVKKVMNK